MGISPFPRATHPPFRQLLPKPTSQPLNPPPAPPRKHAGFHDAAPTAAATAAAAAPDAALGERAIKRFPSNKLFVGAGTWHGGVQLRPSPATDPPAADSPAADSGDVPAPRAAATAPGGGRVRWVPPGASDSAAGAPGAAVVVGRGPAASAVFVGGRRWVW